MIQTNSEIRTAARAFLEGHWGEAVLLTLVFMAIACGCSLIPYVGSFIALIFIPMSWAYEVAFLDHVRGAEGAFALKGVQGFCAYLSDGAACRCVHFAVVAAAVCAGRYQEFFVCPYAFHSGGQAGAEVQWGD